MGFDPDQVSTVTFDSYSTLGDVDAAEKALAARVDDPQPVSKLWLARSLEYTFVANATVAYQPFYEMNRDALQYALDVYGVGISEKGAGSIKPDGPRFDIVCYRGNVAWTRNHRESRDQTPFAVVPKSFVYGVIEAKRTISPGYFPVDSSRAINAQLNDQQEHLDRLGLDVPLILVGAHFAGSIRENQEKSEADDVVLLGDLADKETTEQMARFGTLANVIEVLVNDVEIPSEDLTPDPDEKIQGLQDIVRNLGSDGD